MTDAQKQAWVNVGMAAAVVFAVYKFAPSNSIKAMALGVGGVIAAKQLPVLNKVV